MRNFKNAGDYYLTRSGARMLTVAFPVLGYCATRVTECDHGRCPVSRNGALGVRCLA